MLAGLQVRNSRQWEHTRVIAWTIAAANRDPKKPFPTIRDFMPLPTDPVIDETSEAARMQKAMDDYKERLKQAGL
jgi:hypothetical protein